MVQKEHLENFLRLNGISPTAPDEEIRSALVTANWHDQDVEVALMVLRGEKKGNEVEMIATHQLFHTDAHIAPEMLSSLLGIDVQVGAHQLRASYDKASQDREQFIYYVWLISISVLCTVIVAVGGLYLFDIGPFYAPVAGTSN